MKHTWLHCIILLLTLSPLATAQAVTEAANESAEHTYLQRKHVLMAGAYWQEADAEIRETRDPLPRLALNLGHLGVALGYQFTDVDVSRERRRQCSEYDIEFSGP